METFCDGWKDFGGDDHTIVIFLLHIEGFGVWTLGLVLESPQF